MDHSNDNKNFHIFNWLLSGLCNRLDEFKLEPEKNYKLIGEHLDQPDPFDKLINALKVIGFRPSDMDQISTRTVVV